MKALVAKVRHFVELHVCLLTSKIEVPVDMGDANIVPTITVEDVDKLAETDPESQSPQPIPGAMPAGPAPVIPDWYKIGWRAVGGLDEPALTEGEEKDKAVLLAFLKEQFYGDWYHNAAIIVFVSSCDIFNWLYANFF